MGVSADRSVLCDVLFPVVRLHDVPDPEAIRAAFESCGGVVVQHEHQLLLAGSEATYLAFLAQSSALPTDDPQRSQLRSQLEYLLECDAPRRWRCRDREWCTGQKTWVMGILNVTPDSFSDGGQFFESERAIEHAMRLLEEGADILDIGGESSRPGADPVTADEEIRRVVPVIQELAERSSVWISVDTYKASVAREALQAGAHIVNDIRALADPEMAPLIADTQAGVILMHMRGTPQTMQQAPRYDDVIAEIYQYLGDKIRYALSQGIAEEQIAIDPGIGFGKTLDHNLEILRRLGEFRGLGRPILIGTSRKSFIGHLLNLPIEARLHGTAATVAHAIMQGADIVRVHDVLEMKQIAQIMDALR